MYKLPIKQILLDAFLVPWNEKSHFIGALTPPIFILVCTWSIWAATKPESQIFNYLYYLLYLSAFSYFAVTCHRLILIKNNAQGFYNTVRIIYFLKWLIIIYGISFVLEMISLTIIINLMPGIETKELTEEAIKKHGEIISKNTETIRDLLYLPLMYLVGRLSLIFPATALDLKASIKWSWKATRNNGLNILCVVGLLPWFLYILLSYMQRDNPTIFEQALLALLTYLVAAISIFALSLTYKALQTNAQKQL